MVNPEEANGRRDSAQLKATGASLDDVASPKDQEQAVEPDVMIPARADGGAAQRAQVQKELREFESDYAQLEAAAQMHVNHEHDWERRALLSLQDGRHDVAKDALARAARHTESAQIIRDELTHLDKVIAEYRAALPKMEQEIPKAD